MLDFEDGLNGWLVAYGADGEATASVVDGKFVLDGVFDADSTDVVVYRTINASSAGSSWLLESTADV